MCTIIRQLFSLGKMGQKRDLTESEKPKITKSLSEGCNTLEIAKILGCDHRTIKRFVANSQQGRKKRVEKKRRKLTAKDLRRIKREATRNPLSSSSVIFQNCDLPGVPRSTRCSVLRDMAKVRKAETRPPLNKTHKLKRLDWSRKYLKTDFSKVAGSVMGTEVHFESDARCKVVVGYWYGLALLKMSWLDLFGLEMASKSTPKPTASF